MKPVGGALRRYGPPLAGIIFVLAYYPRFIAKGLGGLWAYPAAAECMLRGEVPLLCRSTLFFYPPILALLFVPLTFVPNWLRDAFWYLILIASFVAILKICESLIRQLFPGHWTERELIQFRVLTFVLNAKLMLSVLENQSYDSLVVLFFMLGFLVLTRRRTILAGASFGMAVALKSTPLIVLPYLLMKRQFGTAATMIVVAVGLSLVPDLVLPPKQSWHIVEWFDEVVLGPARGYSRIFESQLWSIANPLNQSLRGAMARFIDAHARPHEFAVALSVALGLWAVGVSVLILKSLPDDRLMPIDASILAVSMLLLSPVTSRSHFIVLVLPLAILAAAVFREPSKWRVTAGTLGMSFAFVTLSTGDHVGRKISEWSLWFGLPTWGALILVVPLGMLIWTMRLRAKTHS